MGCLGCKFADWHRTKTGALHPNKQGKCTWTVTVQIPICTSGPHRYSDKAGEDIVLTGSYIERDRVYTKPCKVREEA